MNNYTQPYYSSPVMRGQYNMPYTYQQPVYDPNMMQPQPQVQPQQQQQQSVNSIQNYDFVGTFIKSYDEVKTNSFNCERPLFLLDTANDKLYIKQMDNKGVPVISAFNVSPMQSDGIEEIKEDKKDWEKIIADMQNKYDKKIKELEDTIKDIKNTKGSK